MGNAASGEAGDAARGASRSPAVTERRRGSRALPPGAARASPADWPFLAARLAEMLLFRRLEPAALRAVVATMYERAVPAGGILIAEGDAGLAAAELYVVKAGEFEVLERRRGVNLRVNMKRRGDAFGEAALLFSPARAATVAATEDAAVWVLERAAFRAHVRAGQEGAAAALELFLNQVGGRVLEEGSGFPFVVVY